MARACRARMLARTLSKGLWLERSRRGTRHPCIRQFMCREARSPWGGGAGHPRAGSWRPLAPRLRLRARSQAIRGILRPQVDDHLLRGLCGGGGRRIPCLVAGRSPNPPPRDRSRSATAPRARKCTAYLRTRLRGDSTINRRKSECPRPGRARRLVPAGASRENDDPESSAPLALKPLRLGSQPGNMDDKLIENDVGEEPSLGVLVPAEAAVVPAESRGHRTAVASRPSHRNRTGGHRVRPPARQLGHGRELG